MQKTTAKATHASSDPQIRSARGPRRDLRQMFLGGSFVFIIGRGLDKSRPPAHAPSMIARNSLCGDAAGFGRSASTGFDSL